MEIEKIYFDMDGVLADFDSGVLDYCGFRNYSLNVESPPGHEDRLWAAIKQVDRFYYRLKPMPGAIEMFSCVYGKYKDKCEILTGIPKPHREILTAKEDKEQWVKDYLSETVKVNAVLRKDKSLYCTGKGCILIDDYLKNIREWEEMGGTGIAFVSTEQALQELKRIEEEENG